MARTHVVLPVVAGLTLLAGCGAAPATSARLEAAAAPAVPARPVSLTVAEVPGLGDVLTTEDGRTLYLFTQDSTAPSATTCLDECAQKWPPLMATGGIRVTGAEQRLVGTLIRPEGGTQVTVGGWPLYTFAQDTTPGQAEGQGVLGTWFAVTPEGEKAGVPAPVEFGRRTSPASVRRSPTGRGARCTSSPRTAPTRRGPPATASARRPGLHSWRPAR
ncbi:COG4315 family predicted lipoprotein [Actinophytocola algeriensis]|uniref:Putative lipoprotein with Yx(FWY)xxD motif n=1 Tax=Actinophytocola algeriensis TaxID=1768010 RepID=A0A7W7VF94_9PSEU|nr:hypothetical protein [Actinophytocola algeriensis]MBB4908082.1 putative lipoprotein with Yx(FWY)xxD motif [Actinophytocola algeriensis]MBE1480112.1 putative lipoprotein with Yx(FWY)xxD motif [Actinophytocola algeriensis]